MKHDDTTTRREEIPTEVEAAARLAVEAAFKVHRTLGPGLLEKVYEACFTHECRSMGLEVASQVEVPVKYGDVQINAGLRLDLLINGCLIVELKAVEALLPFHQAQVLTYLRVTRHRLALLINFSAPLLKDGIKRIVL